MSEESTKKTGEAGTGANRSEARQAWEEVGQQFQELGVSLAAAFNALWANEETQQHLESLKAGLKSLADEVSVAVNKSAASPEAAKAKVEAKKAAESAKYATSKAFEEARPQITSALKQVNAELQKLIEQLESNEPKN
jgi:hypothetical protein